MKRIFFAVSLAACLLSFSSFATETVSQDLMKSFFQTFKKAEKINWTILDGMLRISFIQDGRQRFAFYANDELVVVATQIEKSELPSQLQAQLAKYEDHHVTEVYRLENDEMNEYCVMLTTGDKQVVLKGKNKLRQYLERKK